MTPFQRHKRKWSKCTSCELSTQRKRIVIARGSIPSDVLLIGEAPGASENVIGKPFVGPAGKLLDRIIIIGFDGQVNYAITNLVACYPREAKMAGVNEPPEKCVVACYGRLQEFYEMVQPKVVVCIGKLAKKHAPKALVKCAPQSIWNIMHPAAILRLDISQKSLAIKRCIATLEDIITTLGQ